MRNVHSPLQIREVLRSYLLENASEAARGLELTDTTPLLSYGILDSIAVMQMLTYLEYTFGIEFEPRDLDRRRLDTIEQIEQLVRNKVGPAPGA